MRFPELLAGKAVTEFSEEKMNPWKLIATAVLFASSLSYAAEQPVYKVVQVAEVFEVRSYEPYVVAEVAVAGPAEEATEQALSLLVGYIYGQNKTDKKIELTTPVMQTSLLASSTGAAAATQSEDSAECLVRLMMPKSYLLSALPEPLDPRRLFHAQTKNRLRSRTARRRVEQKLIWPWRAGTGGPNWSHAKTEAHISRRLYSLMQPHSRSALGTVGLRRFDWARPPAATLRVARPPGRELNGSLSARLVLTRSHNQPAKRNW